MRSRGIITSPTNCWGVSWHGTERPDSSLAATICFRWEPFPGLTAGVPPGKRAFAIGVDQLAGARGLLHGDHFDLLAGVPVDMEKSSGTG